MRGKLIVIEGTDCSGKETQTNLVMKKLLNEGIEIEKFTFPNYDSPTGRIIGGPYLGKEYLCDGWFSEGANQVDPKVASLYFAADRRYNIPLINKTLESGKHVILDRYVFSNMAHQGGKIKEQENRQALYQWIEDLEFSLLELPKPDIGIFLHMPYEGACILKQDRKERSDQHESNEEHLRNAELSYLEIAHKYDFKTIECMVDNKIKAIEDINQEVYESLIKRL
ncbi:MAG: dTMP kinase [Bacilli bacterium]|nr:dTMP kinase [Bacilli bacterium]MDD4808578.1 dTMP kinase [Bacilli bacterium]